MTWSSLAVATCAAFAVCGCASAPIGERADGGAPVCTRVYPTGSNIPTTHCYSAEEAADAQRYNDWLRLQKTGTGVPKSAAGG